jgi:hypothetical protein
MRALVPLLILLSVLASSGCVENIRSLKDKVSPAAAEAEDDAQRALEQARLLAENGNRNNTSALRPPVARIALYGANGALVYKASFVGENLTAPITVDAGVPLTLIATDSEAIQADATITSYAWTIAGAASTGPRVGATWNDSGAYPVTLRVTDSNGLTDDHHLVLVVPAKPFDVTTNKTTSPMAGSMGAGQDGSVKFDLKLADAKIPAIIQSVRIVTPAMDTCDASLEVLDADGKAVGKSDKGGLSTKEEALLGAAPEGTYTVKVGIGDACIAKDGVTVSMVVTYLPIIEGLSADPHAGHAH